MTTIHFRRLVAAVVKESGICRQTVEQVLPAAFDVMRRTLVEGEKQCVMIESFGTFAVKEMPARRHHFVRRDLGRDEWIDRPAKQVLRFAPTRNMRREIESGQFDPTRRSFEHHPDDPHMRTRSNLCRINKGTPVTKVGGTIWFKKKKRGHKDDDLKPENCD